MSKKKIKSSDSRGERGMGTMIKKVTGIYETQVTIGVDPITKKRIRETFSSLEEKDVKAKRIEFLQKRNRYRGEYTENLTLTEWLKEWLEDIKAIAIAPTTFAKYNTLIKTHITPRLGDLALRNITQKNIQQFINTIFKEGTPRKKMVINENQILEETTVLGKSLSPSTVIECHSILFAALNLATSPDLKLIEYNPCANTQLPKFERRKRGIFEKEDVILLLQEAKKADIEANEKYTKFKIEEICCWYLAIKLIFQTGFRRGELLGLKWADLNLKEGQINLQQAYVALHGKGTQSNLKTKTSYRGLPIQADTLLEIKNWKEKQRQMKLRNKKTYKDADFIFTDSTGLPINPNWFSKKMKKLQAKIGLKELSPHCVRHTVATELLQQNIPITDVQVWGGWKSPRVLLENYSHALPSNKEKSLQILSNLTKEKEPSTIAESSN